MVNVNTLPQQLQVELEKTNFVYEHLAIGLIINLLVGGALFFLMRHSVDMANLVIWCFLLVFVVSIRFFLLYLYRASNNKEARLSSWQVAFVLGAFAMGVVWGVGGVILFPPHDLARQIFLGFVLIGMVMGALPFLSPIFPSYILFAVSSIVPFSFYLFTVNDELHMVFGFIGLSFVLAMLFSSRVNQKNFLKNQMLRFSNENLVQKLNAANHELEHKIQLKNKIEKDLRDNESRFKALSDAAYDGVILHNKGVIIEVNEALVRMIGVAGHDLIGSSVLALVAKECREEMNQQFFVHDKRMLETSFLRKDGSVFTAELNRGGLSYHGQDVCIVSIRDVSKQRKIEDDLLHAKNAAQAADKLKSEFLASVSHELRTPLNAVLGFIQILEDTQLTTEQHEYLGMGGKAARQLLLLINDLLDLSRIESGHIKFLPQNTELKDFLSEIIQILSPRAKELGSQLSLDIMNSSPVWVEIDPDRVRQVLMNLLGNALKFSAKEEGKVKLMVTTKISPQEQPLLLFEVIDNGIGVSADQQDIIFKRFVQLDASISRKYGGAGLGLAISQELVHNMGGDIGIISQPGAGSTFWFTLPCIEVKPTDLTIAEGAKAKIK